MIGALAAAAWVIWSKGDEPTQISLGQRLYADHCASCHGAKLEGQPDWQTLRPGGRMPAPPHDATGHTWHHSDEELHRITKHGMSAVVQSDKSEMPAFEDVLSDREIEAVLAFIKSNWPAKERAYQQEMSSRR